ncbi:hypothetical protein SCB71_14565 [Herbiconiux sp. KACC 21604]|uniref:hypothetical protein n=1 Tax=unclassified Herbiconiux TaxID=2618217 RepID=UPI0014931230|nr:hypothetical protein [Herbiconiux sp. SALV-R1]QJU54366.1 hypothetical protein HL652_12505 [Herbiconiux sp. SALV-R1]WPO85436.1 hypothetical protein SCB71_14565 [Herbiconiux sp. KACC 21604]
MNAAEVNVFLTRAALLDPRMKRVDPMEQADMATAWADVLDDVALVAALTALKQHYRGSSDPITPARVVELAVREMEPVLPDITGEVVAEDMRRQLAAAGVSEADWRRYGHNPAWVAEHFDLNAVEAAS